MSSIILLTEQKEVKIYRATDLHLNYNLCVEHPEVPEVRAVPDIKISKISPNDRQCLLLDLSNSAWLVNYDVDGNHLISKIPVSNIDDVAAGLTHSVVLDFSGKVWIFGKIRPWLNYNTWQEITGLPKIRKIFSHANASYFQDYDENFWVLGRSPFKKDSLYFLPFKWSFDFQVRDISNGDADHLLVTDKEGNVYGIGLNDYKQMLNTSTENYDHLVLLPFPKAKKILAVGHCSIVLDYNGIVWISGELFCDEYTEMEKFDEKYVVDIEVFAGSALCIVDIEGNMWIYGYLDGPDGCVEFKSPTLFNFDDLIAWEEHHQRSPKSGR